MSYPRETNGSGPHTSCTVPGGARLRFSRPERPFRAQASRIRDAGRRLSGDLEGLVIQGYRRPVNMGGTGDHWLTDLKSWNVPAFGEPIDGLLRDVLRFGGQQLLEKEPWAPRLDRAWPRWTRTAPEDLRDLAADLRLLRDNLHSQAAAAGWEVD